jgi:hypothetical protein
LLEHAVDPAMQQLIAPPAPHNVAAPAKHDVAAPAKQKRKRPARAREQSDCPACTCGQRAAAEAVRKQNEDLEPKDRKKTCGHTLPPAVPHALVYRSVASVVAK